MRSASIARLALYLAIAVVLLAAPFLIDAMFGRAWVRITDVALLFVMLALGLNIVVGYAGLLDLGYIAFFAVGAYCYALLASPQFDIHWVHNFYDFGTNWVPQYGVNVGYRFGD